MLRRFIIVLALLACLASVSVADTTPTPASPPSPAVSASAASTDAPDPYIWLEDVHGARAMAWVEAENAKTLGVLEKDPRFASLYADALKIAQAQDRIPAPTFIQSQIYNFWQDQDHVRGIWRRTTLAQYSNPAPAWETVLDLDALAKSENANWVWQGAECYWPEQRRCLLHLSDGGEDADTVREYDVNDKAFPTGGFVLPRGKQDIAWVDGDTLLAAREWNPGEMTSSGYPYVVKRLKRGQALSNATEVFRGKQSDVGVSPLERHDGQGHRVVMIVRNMTFFTSEYYLVTSAGTRRLQVPLKAEASAMIAGRLLFILRQDWVANGTTFPQGSLVSLDLAAATADPEHLKPTLVYSPGPRESLEGVNATRSHLMIATLDNVRGRAYVYTPVANGAWTKRRLELADNSTVSLVAADQHGQNAFLYVTSFLTPTSLWLTNTGSGSLAMVKAMPPKFDASNDVVEQHEATSKDGTQIPYFIVHPAQMKLDGSNPTILYAYGGFQISETPMYSGLLGKLWLERGGVYVLANIRGGGEFGPAWHDAGLTVHRQRIYDDFAAVAQDLIAKKITSPRRLGIQGGSNGGLLMGVEFTQHPELWNAVDIQVPLLDMLRFEQIDAGASWVAEYGSVSNPEQRAFLASISPYNNIKAGVTYPQPLIWTTTKDDRVGPQHARKFAAKLSAMGIPYYFYEVTEGGHGAGANLNERAHTTSLEMIYFTRKLVDE
jgi:prolyl oligopeptidase